MYGPQEARIDPKVMLKREAMLEQETRIGAIAGGSPTLGQVRQRPAMEGLMEALIHNICVLEDTVATLDGRTQPIRNQAPQVEKNLATQGIPAGSPIGASIAHQTMRIQNLNQRIQSIMAELEI